MGNPNNFFTDKISFRTIDKYRIIYFILFIASFVLTEIGRYVYRPFIYSQNINDFGIADSIGNSGGILVQIFFALTILNSSTKKGLRLITFFVFGYIAYEIIQPLLPRGTFDWLDIYGTIIGGVLAIVIFLILRKVIKNNGVYYRF